MIDNESIDDALRHLNERRMWAQGLEDHARRFLRDHPDEEGQHVFISSTNIRLRYDRTIETLEKLIAFYRGNTYDDA